MSEEDNISGELREMQSPLADMARVMPYVMPEGYFAAAQEKMVLLAKTPLREKLDAPYSVPDGYFEALPAKVLAAATREKPAIPTRAFVPRVQWATAAMLAIMISVGGYIMFRGQVGNEPEHLLSSVSQTDIKEYVERRYGVPEVQNAPDNSVAALKLNAKDVESYLNDTGWE